MQKFTICLLIALFATVCLANDKINNLPGYNDHVKFNQYSGYLMANETNGRFLFYWFLESQNSPSNDPVVLWMNGGPGCSSNAGLLMEHGPFLVNDDGTTLRTNDYSWNKVANMIYLESPAGVGFSYSKNPKVDYKELNDDKSANDVYNAMIEFFKRYPQFQKNDFYVAGESYAGHYVPTTTYRIHQGNLAGQNPKINLKGFLVGNGVTDDETDTNSVPPFLYNHALISDEDYQTSLISCQNNYYKNQNDPICALALNNMWVSITGVNPYNMYGPCLGDKGPFALKKAPQSVSHPLFNMWRLAGQIGSNGGAPCIDSKPTEKYFSLQDVKVAIHAREDIKWQFCNDQINEAYNRTYDSMIPFYQKLLSAGVRALVYSGDIDLAVNVMGSQLALEKLATSMQATVTEAWRTWGYDSPQYGKQVGGMTQTYSNGISLITHRGSGHMVPQDNRPNALLMFSNFLNKKPMPPSN